MALLQINFNSTCLAMQTNITVIIPETSGILKPDFNGKLKTLYLLHGLSNDNTIYTRYTNIERYACDKNLAVIMPSVDHSFYADMKYGHKYYSYICEELPTFMRNIFPLSAKREDTFIAGHSMGGYGTFKIALMNPDKFAAAASMSGVLDINVFLQDGIFEGFNPKSIYGDTKDLTGSENDLFHLLKNKVKAKTPLPKLFQICGTEDFLYQSNLNFKEFAQNLKIDLTYEEKSGDHDWGFWEESIKKIIDWLPLQNSI